MEENILKTIVEASCPHCKKDILIESQTITPTINSVFTKEDVVEAKKDCKLRVEALSIDGEKKQAVISWLDKEETVFAPAEVDSVIQSLLEPTD